MFARFRFAPLYVTAVLASCCIAWIFAYVVVHYFQFYSAAERSFRAVVNSIPLALNFSLLAIGLLRRKLKNQKEEFVR